ncbi:hypothetical protein LPJ53_001708 [Coemansia erecta]|uniref:BTB domain-containing protein n=1 Tax=Coemansia erecta TaxID=147472 RepID=A0A9W7Y3M6_9FUNG|nr:hypothetical protein LPJ53_001708 [Coemansia erecta]
MSPGNLQYVYRWRIGQWSTLAPCIEHNSPAFDADGLRWVFKLFKGRARNPRDLALYLAVHESTTDRLQQLKKKVDVSFTLENQRTRGLDYNKYTTPITVWVDSAYSTWGDDKFISLDDMDSFILDDMTCLVVRFHVRETVHEGPTPTAQPSPAIAVYVPEKISAPFNQLLKSARFSDIQFELRDSIGNVLEHGGQPSPPNSSPDGDSRPLCVTPMPGNCYARAMPYANHKRIGGAEPAQPPSGPRYHAHKAILMAVSPVFEAMFSNGMRETFEKTVEVWDVTPRAFERMLEFAYTHACDLDVSVEGHADVSADEVVETLLCADQFEVAGLRDICWRNLMSRLSVDTVWDIWSIAVDLEVPEHQRACRSFCCRKFTELCRHPTTMWASAHLLREVLASDALNVESEELLYETVVKWAEFREDSMDSVLPSPRSANARKLSGSAGNVLSAEKHMTRSGLISDEAVLKCYRSPSNLSLLPPRSPWTNRGQRQGHPRRKPELTREAYTSASEANAAPTPSPRLSVISATRLQSSRNGDSPLASANITSPASSHSSVWSTLSDRKEFLPSLLPCIRFPMMDKNFLLRVVERNSELMTLPLMKDLLIEAYRFHAFNPPQIIQTPLSRPHSSAHRRSSECFAKKEYSAQLQTAQPIYAKIILPLNTSDDLALSRSQRRKPLQKVSIQNVSYAS